MRKIFAAAFILFSSGARAQSVRHPVNIYWLSSGQYLPEWTTSASFAANPASVSSSAGWSAGTYTEKQFMTEGLNLLALSAMLARAGSAAGIHLQYFGNPDYNELQAGINYGKSLGKITVGISVGYNSMRIAGSERESAFTVQLATVCSLTDNLYASVQLINPRFKPRIPQSQVASIYRFGLGYRHSSRAYSCIEFYKEEDQPPQIIVGVRYLFADHFFARAGFITGTSQIFGGLGWKWKVVRVEVISRQHTTLGLSPGILITYKKDEKY